jgi:hypothetical protein
LWQLSLLLLLLWLLLLLLVLLFTRPMWELHVTGNAVWI